MKYLIALDLDGTLIEGLYNLKEYTIKVFKKIKELGNDLVIVTGRPFRSSYFVYKALGLNTPIINYNGSLISNPITKEIYFSDELDRNEVLRLYNERKEDYSLFFCEYFDNIFTNVSADQFELLMHINTLSKTYTGDLNNILKNNVHGSLILAKDGHGKILMDYINSNFKSFSARLWAWGPYKEIVELYSNYSSKGTALNCVREILKYSKESVIACGDSQNDHEFFEEAGITVSLKNADPRIKEKSTYVYDKEAEREGLAHFFNEFLDLGIEDGN